MPNIYLQHMTVKVQNTSGVCSALALCLYCWSDLYTPIQKVKADTAKHIPLFDNIVNLFWTVLCEQSFLWKNFLGFSMSPREIKDAPVQVWAGSQAIVLWDGII